MIPRKQMSPFAPRKYAHGGAVGSCSAGELARQSTPLSRERKATMGVGKPGGFTNRVCYPRAGGAVVLPGGFCNRLAPGWFGWIRARCINERGTLSALADASG